MDKLPNSIINKFVDMLTPKDEEENIINTFLASISKIETSTITDTNGDSKKIQTIYVVLAGNTQEIPAKIFRYNEDNINTDIRVGDAVIVKIENHSLMIIEDLTNPAAILDIPNSVISSITIGDKLYFENSKKNKIELASIISDNNLRIGNDSLDVLNILGKSVLINNKKPALIGSLYNTNSCKSANVTIAAKTGAKITATAPTLANYTPRLIYGLVNPHSVAWHITQFGTTNGDPWVNVYNNASNEYSGQFTFYLFYIRTS